VIAGNKDGSVDALADGMLGTLLDPDDTSSLCFAIVEALGRPPTPGSLPADRFRRAAFERHVEDLVKSLPRNADY
jgi:hypothetical protein